MYFILHMELQFGAHDNIYCPRGIAAWCMSKQDNQIISCLIGNINSAGIYLITSKLQCCWCTAGGFSQKPRVTQRQQISAKWARVRNGRRVPSTTFQINTRSLPTACQPLLETSRAHHAVTRLLIMWLQIISYSSARGGVSVATERGETSRSVLLIQKARPTDSGNYQCNPSNARPANVTVHVLNGK